MFDKLDRPSVLNIVCKMNGDISSLLSVNKDFYSLLCDPYTVRCIAQNFISETSDDAIIFCSLMKYVLMYGDKSIGECLPNVKLSVELSGGLFCSDLLPNTMMNELLSPLFKVDTPVWYVKLILGTINEESVVETLYQSGLEEFRLGWFHLARETLSLLLPITSILIGPYNLFETANSNCDCYDEKIIMVIDNSLTTGYDTLLSSFILDNEVVSDHLINVCGANVGVSLANLVNYVRDHKHLSSYIPHEEGDEGYISDVLEYILFVEGVSVSDARYALEAIKLYYLSDDLDEPNVWMYEQLVAIYN